MKPFGKMKTRLVIEAKIRAETALHVGCGGSLEPSGTDSPVIKTADGKPFIPGSSIKGALRSFAEQLLRTMGEQNIKGPEPPPESGVWACEPFAGSCCLDKKVSPSEAGLQDLQLVEERYREQGPARVYLRARNIVDGRLDDTSYACDLFEWACYACRLFGCQYFAGRIAVADAFADGEVATQVRDGVGIDRDTGTAKEGIKYDFEVVEPGAEFNLRIVCENLDEPEEAFFAHLLKLWRDEGLRLGGKTTRGLGLTRLRDIKVQRCDADALVGVSEPEKVELDTLADKLSEHWRRGDA